MGPFRQTFQMHNQETNPTKPYRSSAMRLRVLKCWDMLMVEAFLQSFSHSSISRSVSLVASFNIAVTWRNIISNTVKVSCLSFNRLASTPLSSTHSHFIAVLSLTLNSLSFFLSPPPPIIIFFIIAAVVNVVTIVLCVACWHVD